jgi:hypothetical protein
VKLKIFASGLLLLGVIGLAQSASAADVPAFGFSSYGSSTAGDYTEAFNFTITQTIKITALGFFDESGTPGLAVNHEVRVYDSTNALVLSAIVLAGTVEPLIGDNATTSYRYDSTLVGDPYLSGAPSGTTYRLAFNIDGDRVLSSPIGLHVSSPVTLGAGFYAPNSPAGVFTFPNNFADNPTQYYAGNFLFTTEVPEPATVGVVACAAVLLCGRGRRRTA